MKVDPTAVCRTAGRIAAPAALLVVAEEDLAGSYAIEGWDSGQAPANDAPYRGTGSLERRGGAYVYKGAMDGYNYSGVGVYDPEARSFALHFEEVESGRTGDVQYRNTDGRLEDFWEWMDEVDGNLR